MARQLCKHVMLISYTCSAVETAGMAQIVQIADHVQIGTKQLPGFSQIVL